MIGMTDRLRQLSPRHMVFMFMLTVLVITRSSVVSARSQEENCCATVGYSSSVFSYLDRENTQAAARLWTNLLSRKQSGAIETRIYQSQAELQRELEEKRVDLVVLLPSEYLLLKNRNLLEPLHVSTRANELYDSLLLITRSDSGIATVAQLKGKSLLQPRGPATAIHRMWLETLTARQGIPDPKRYFASTKDVISSSQALMPVFFRRADACVISRNSFNVMAELNPQLKKELRVVEETEPMATAMICARRGSDRQQREKLREILEGLHLSVEGRQLLTLFRMSRLIPYRPAYLESSLNFMKRYIAMKNTAPRGAR